MNDDTQARLAVNELVPQLCDGCGKPLVTKAEQNRRLDFGMAWCDACEEAAEKDECRCSYGFYHYGDPRQFVPDEEMNTPGELAAWRAACEAWERGEHVQAGVNKAGAVDATKIAFAMEGQAMKDFLGYDTLMRKDDHQFFQPMYVVSLGERGPKEPFDEEKTGWGWKTLGVVKATDTVIPTTCKMNIPS